MGIIDQINASRALNAAVPAVTQNAKLPASYEHAKQALAACASLDECQSWADKAAALASYAKQAKDDELMKQAIRIRDRAVRRSGELLKQIEPGPGARSDLGPVATRGSIASSAGMSERQAKTAIRVANVPAQDFERQVESETPPTVTALASQGTKPAPVIDLKGRDPGAFNRSLHFMAELEDYAKALGKFDLDLLLPALIPPEAARVRKAISTIDAIHDRIITRI